MLTKQLRDWIKSEEARGFTKQQLRDQLIKLGYSDKQVKDALTLAKTHQKTKLKTFLKPTPLKLFFPVVFFIIIMASFIVNISSAPDFGDTICQYQQTYVDIQQETQAAKTALPQWDPSPAALIGLVNLQRESTIRLKELALNFMAPWKHIFLGNMYFHPDMMHLLNPLFPFPCELDPLTIYDSNPAELRCGYYLKENHYQCLVTLQEMDEGIGSFSWLDTLTPYHPINFLDFFINALLFIVVIYLIVCAISFALQAFLNENKKMKIILTSLLVAVPALSFGLAFVFDNMFFMYIVFLLPLFILFSILLFNKQETTRKKILWVAGILLILSLIAGLFIVDAILQDKIDLSKVNIESHSLGTYETVYCENTKIVTAEDLNLEPEDIPTDVTPYMCVGPTCYELCEETCSPDGWGHVEQIYGNNPYCLCGCQ